MTGLLDMSAKALAAAVRSGELSAVELVHAHINRIEEVNPAINAVTARRYERALDEARQAQELVVITRDKSTLPPLLGLPYTAKEYIEAQDMPLSAGIWERRDVVGEQDAPTISRLRAAGAILLGISNVPEGGLWLETYNDVYGRTVNPWDRRRTAGGSSGGEGAIVSTGGASFGLGADVGGSIRIPAAFCGTVGHKPTGRMVPNTGFFPPAVGEMNGYLVIGPLTRRVEDVMPILRALAGPDGEDPCCKPWDLGDPDAVRPEELTVYPVPSNGFSWVSKANKDAVTRAATELGAAGASVRELDPKKLKRAFMIWASMMSSTHGPTYAEILGKNGRDLAVTREMLKLALGRSKHTLPALVIAGVEKITAKIPGQVEASIEQGKALQAELESILGPNGVMLHPPYTRPAPRHYGPMATPLDFVCTGLFNVLEFPSTVVPMGFDTKGVPLSVQVIGARGRDHVTLAAAQLLEQATGGWTRANPSWRLDKELKERSLVHT